MGLGSFSTSRVLLAASLLLACAAASAYELLPTFDLPLTRNPLPLRVERDAAGRLYVVGDVDWAGGQRHAGLVRLSPAGVVDASYVPRCPYQTVASRCIIRDIEVAPDGTVFVAGDTEPFQRAFIAKLAPDGSVVEDWRPDLPFFDLQGSAASTRLWLRGSMLTVFSFGLLPFEPDVAALRFATTGAGARDPGYVVRVPGGATEADMDAQGNLFACEQNGSRIAKFAAGNGNRIPAFDAVASCQGMVYAPPLDAVVTQSAQPPHVRAFDGATGAPRPDFAPNTGFVLELAVDGHALYVSPNLAALGGHLNAARIPFANDDVVEEVASYDDATARLVPTPEGLVVASSESPNGLVRFTGGHVDAAFAPPLRRIGSMGAALVDGGDTYLAGDANRIGAATTTGLFRVRNGSVDETWRPGTRFRNASFLARDGNWLVAANVDTAEGRGYGGIVRFDVADGHADAWDIVGFNIVNAYRRSIVLAGGWTYIFGAFVDQPVCGGPPRSSMVRISGTTPCTVDPAFAGSRVYYEVVDGGDGWFYGSRVDAKTGWYEVRRIDAATGAEDPSWSYPLPEGGPVRGMAIVGEALWLARVPDGTDPPSWSVLERVKRDTAQLDTSWTSPYRDFVERFAVAGDSIFVAGRANDESQRIAVRRIDLPSGQPDAAWRFDSDATSITAIAPLDASTVVVAGDMTQANGVPRVGVAAYGVRGGDLFRSSFE